jgi:DNA-directed RNA polymerase specialized sigma24 family protein
MSEASRKKPPAPEPDPDPDLLDEADQEAESEAGDEALPPESEHTDEPVASPVLDAERRRLHDRLDDPHLRRRVLRFIIRKHSLAEDVAEDVTQEAFARACRAKNIPPESAKLFPWLRRFANYCSLEHQRKVATHTAREQADERIDEHALERSPEDERAADVARIASDLAREDPRHTESLQMWHARAEGVPIVAIAVEANLTEEAAKKRMQRFAQLVQQRWVEASAALVAAVAALLLYLHTRVPYPTPKPTGPDPVAMLAPLPPPLPPEVIRNEGLERCTEEKWEECLAILERAGRADPVGNHTPTVQAAKTKALNELKKKMIQEDRDRAAPRPR